MSDSSDAGAIITPVDEQPAPALLEPLSPQQFARVRRALSRSPFFVDDATFLRVRVTSNALQQTVRVAWRKSTIEGDVQVNQVDVSATTNFQTVVFDTLVGAGLLYNVTAFSLSASSPTVTTFVQVQLVYGSGSGAVVLATLVANYVTTVQAIGWPGTPVVLSTDGPGYPVDLNFAPGAPGTELTLIVDAGSRLRLIAVRTIFTTAAGGGNRVPFLVCSAPSGAVIFGAPLPVAIAPSTQNAVQWASDFTPQQAPGLLPQLGQSPNHLLLASGSQIATVTVNLAGADQYQPFTIHAQQWLEVT